MESDTTVRRMDDIPADLSHHAEEVAELWVAYSRGENERVPITFACDEQVWLKISGHTFREFYTNPEVHLKAQLEGRLWVSNNIIGDMRPGPPEHWHIGIQLWMEENEFFGCEVVYQEDDYAWAKPLPLAGEDLLHYLSDIDPEERVRQSSTLKMYEALDELSDGMTFAGKPVYIARPGGGTHGIFTKAAEIRGIGQLCLDIYDDPDFVEKFLHLVTEKTIDRIKAWHRVVVGTDPQLPSEGGFGFCDDSLQLISAEVYERHVLPYHERLCSAMATGGRSIHLCGRASQHYSALRHKLNITALDGPGTFVDHGHYLRELGPDLTLAAQTDHSVLAKGSESEIDSMMKQMLTPEAKMPGRFSIMGFLTQDTPVRNTQICYQSGRKYGIIRKSKI